MRGQLAVRRLLATALKIVLNPPKPLVDWERGSGDRTRTDDLTLSMRRDRFVPSTSARAIQLLSGRQGQRAADAHPHGPAPALAQVRAMACQNRQQARVHEGQPPNPPRCGERALLRRCSPALWLSSPDGIRARATALREPLRSMPVLGLVALDKAVARSAPIWRSRRICQRSSAIAGLWRRRASLSRPCTSSAGARLTHRRADPGPRRQ